MSHFVQTIDIADVLEADPIRPGSTLKTWMWVFVSIGIVTLLAGVILFPAAHLWAAYYTNLVFFMGISCGGVVLAAAFQIVRATWSAPVRRMFEASSAFFPYAYLLFLATWFGRHELFPWANAPAAGKEWWMQPGFVYARFAILFAILFVVLSKFVRLSLRSDIGFLKEKSGNAARWDSPAYDALTHGWKGSEVEIAALQKRMSIRGPVVIMCYAVIYSLFAFEMIMAMDKFWYSNMFGGFVFIGNMYGAWAMTALTVFYHNKHSAGFSRNISTNQLWDMAKLTFAFIMLWGYLFWCQFLPQWYGNLPEETQWMILRTREYPWKTLGWLAFACSFVIPFIMLLSRDVKRTPWAYGTVATIILFGLWVERYVLIMPQISPTVIPFGFLEIGFFLGFLGTYVLSVQNFLSKYPFVALSHPQAVGNVKW